MLVRDLIAELQKLIDRADPEYLAVMGEPTIEIDMFRWNEAKQAFDYLGVSPEVRITPTADGVYDVLTAIES